MKGDQAVRSLRQGGGGKNPKRLYTAGHLEAPSGSLEAASHLITDTIKGMTGEDRVVPGYTAMQGVGL